MIIGTGTTCNILTNTPFSVSGLSEVNLSTINITDDNGLDVSECFGITTDIITVDGTNVTLSGDCDTSLEILITQGLNIPINCDYVSYEVTADGILIFTFADGIRTYTSTIILQLITLLMDGKFLTLLQVVQ